MEQKLKQIIGDLVFQNAAMAMQIEALQKEIEELKKPTPDEI